MALPRYGFTTIKTGYGLKYAVYDNRRPSIEGPMAKCDSCTDATVICDALNAAQEAKEFGRE